MPARSPLLKPLKRLGGRSSRPARAGLVRPYTNPAHLPPVSQVEGLNQPESRVYYALVELRIQFSMQTNFLGGSILGGARADFVIASPPTVLLLDGPFHNTGYGLGRDTLVDQTYIASGYRVVHLSTDRVDDNIKRTLVELIGVPA